MDLLRPGETCWRRARARRLRFLVDGQDYFSTLLGAMRRARRSIHFLGWSFDPRTRLTPDAADPAEIGRLLIALTDRDPALDVRLLIWRSALPISATQSFFPHRAKGWFRGSRVRFELDDTVPFGACHHQKAVVIDDSIAFIGGADFGCDRWDTCRHLDGDPYRLTAARRPCSARHEVVALIDGPLAASLGELFRTRWRTAVGPIPDPSSGGEDAWPPGVVADIEQAPAAIARTAPFWRAQPEIQEIEALTLAAIGSAEHLIYIENQYFTWPVVVEALARRLAEPDGPEIVLICPARSPSYFDRITMDRARSIALWRLATSDVFGRFHPLAPYTAAGRVIIAHAKLMIVDDRLARISSANLNNRSNGFDTECELAVEAETQAHRSALANLRNRLAGHWIGQPPAAVAEMARLAGGLAEALWALDGGRRLRRLGPRRLGLVGEFIAEFHIGDPSDPTDSWRPWARRERLLAEARKIRAGPG